MSAAPLFDHLHVIIDKARPGAVNMAIDQALLESSTTPVLRVYDWDVPTISLGYSHEFVRRDDHLPVVRRWTGGGIVRHERDATYALVVPQAHAFAHTRPLDSYRLLHSALVECLIHIGCGPCRLATEADQQTGALCFAAPAKFDVLRAERKIAGAGQRRGRLGLLHQGSVALPLTREFWQTFARTLAREATFGDAPAEDVMQRAQQLVQARYGTETWLHSKRDAASALT